MTKLQSDKGIIKCSKINPMYAVPIVVDMFKYSKENNDVRCNMNQDGKYMAYVTRVKRIVPLKGVKDLEVVVTDEGNGCVVRKDDNYKVADECIYVMPGAVLPRLPEYKFMEKYNYVVERRQICGHWSNGMILKPSALKVYVGDKLNLSVVHKAGDGIVLSSNSTSTTISQIGWNTRV